MRAAAGRSDRGETLIELLVAIAILSTAVIAVVGCLVTGIMVSSIHRQQTVAGVTLHNYAEEINRTVDAGGYPAGCAALAVSFTAPAGYTASITRVRYWPPDLPPGTNPPYDGSNKQPDGSQWLTSCSTDSGVRQLTLQVASTDSRAVEQFVIVVRKPCGLADPLCS